jgi:hypothetical protein
MPINHSIKEIKKTAGYQPRLEMFGI